MRPKVKIVLRPVMALITRATQGHASDCVRTHRGFRNEHGPHRSRGGTQLGFGTGDQTQAAHQRYTVYSHGEQAPYL